MATDIIYFLIWNINETDKCKLLVVVKGQNGSNELMFLKKLVKEVKKRDQWDMISKYC